MKKIDIESNEKNLKWWKKKSFHFNLTIILLLFFYLFLEKIIFPFAIIGFIAPILIVFIIILNSIYFITYGIISFLSKKRLLVKEQLKRIYFILLSISIAIIVYYAIVDYKDLYRINQRHKELGVPQNFNR